MPYLRAVHEVIETRAYLASAKNAGMTADEMEAAVMTVAADPMAGDLIVGSSGCRKVRLAGRGRGKSGGYRLITFYKTAAGAVFLLNVISKGMRANLSDAEVNDLAILVKRL